MLAETMDASAAAYHVGYASRSQFTREYTRPFGARPFGMSSKFASNLSQQNYEAVPSLFDCHIDVA
jgi:AraC-like DNA-binding protein